MTDVMLTRSQAYEAVQEYLAEFLRQSTNASLGTVLSDVNPYTWGDGQSADPAVPWDWSNAAAAVVARSASPSLPGGGAEFALPEQRWLAALHAFLDSMWPILDRVPLPRLLELLALPNVAVEGSDLSPWQRWLAATEAIVGDAPKIGTEGERRRQNGPPTI